MLEAFLLPNARVAAFALALALSGCSKPPPPVLAELPAFSLESESGGKIDKSFFSNGPVVVGFFFTRCPTVCPRLVASLANVETSLGENAPRFLLVSVDPENDTPEELRKFREKAKLSSRFTLVTGAFSEVIRVTENGFHVGVSGKADEKAPNFGITHGTHFVLVDGNGAIRGYYASEDPEKVHALEKDLGRL